MITKRKREKLGATTYTNIEHLFVLFVRHLSSEEAIGETMAGQATSWADQWGPGGMGAMEEDDLGSNAKKDEEGKKAKGGFTKAKEAALLGAHKLRSSTLNGVNWIKKQRQKKNSSTNK